MVYTLSLYNDVCQSFLNKSVTKFLKNDSVAIKHFTFNEYKWMDNSSIKRNYFQSD